MAKKQKYEERVAHFCDIIAIAETLLENSHNFDSKTKRQLLEFWSNTKYRALNAEPLYRKIASLKYLETAFFTYFNEEESEIIKPFWEKVNEISVIYVQKNTFQLILKRGKIKDIYEYEYAVDNFMCGEEEGKLNKDQITVIGSFIDDFENRQLEKAKKNT